MTYDCFAEEYYNQWNIRYNEASVALDEREEKIEAISEELETDLRLLGATAIEDKLQDGVPETIADLKEAGIKVWVATGDKLETAIGTCLLLFSKGCFFANLIASYSHRTQY